MTDLDKIPFSTDEDCARQMDKNDPLAGFRERFYIPAGSIYLDGNSLGLLSRDAEASLMRVLREWKNLAIDGWLKGVPPWFYYAEQLGSEAARLVGAESDEVIVTGTTTVNIHALISTFYSPRGQRTKILADQLNFPTDIYALKGQIQQKGLNENEHLILVPSRDGHTLLEEDIIAAMSAEVDVALLPSVLYRSGQLLDIPRLTDAAHQRGIAIGFDCSHSVGAVPHQFDRWDVDFALWCSYKYLNSGPGSPAFIYINRRHFTRQPLMTGWFGYVKEKQFDMLLDFEHQKGAGGWQISSPGILGAAAVEGALRITLEADINNIRQKSLHMTSYLIYLVQQLLSASPYHFTIVTPEEAQKRGGHIALCRDEESYRISLALRAMGIIPDFRPPNIIRIAPVALYNTYLEVWLAVQAIRDIIDKKSYTRFSPQRNSIT